ncbi:MAG: hypothetical protein RIT14_908, partial [Pseudomonadota bacterium]
MTGVILAVLSLALLGIHGLSCLLVGRRLRSVVPQRVTETPFISLLRPVCGLDRFDPHTLATSFRLDYPDYEVIFCVACGNDPVVPVVRRLIADHPEVDARLLIGETRISANPKLNNLEKGWKAARGEIVVMADANLLLPHDYLW